MSWGKFRVRGRVRKTRMLAWTLKCVAGTCDAVGVWRSACALVC